ncbi:uncharacterized protein B4U79_15895 [Dinothrombium tinctorium]|uniref:Bridge-like lipid transfer protein family member 1 C-terminal domain-containing protein n=1 Tax=Dinothrombium tinctorium TaxID=1965070 RepID=A0A3S3P9V8_9ACAR|nr:uncharacterized protein B4U79_03781 [Dinothrombium tinctorium]RWS11729.1 uncharacterized protein B4U79_00025 [Dinothrombium tinctorium]RWS13557.1 uncharacterized protein B4U79_15895 [Dinothrombium tinctorium]
MADSDFDLKRNIVEATDKSSSPSLKVKDIVNSWNITTSIDDVALDMNLIWLLFFLLLLMIWFTYILYYNSRLFGYILTKIVNHIIFPKYLFYDHKSNCRPYFKVGSFSLSAISGKIMFRDVIYVTPDYSVRIQDGWFIFRWWIPYKPKDVRKCDFSHCEARISVLLNGFELHIYNRSQLYSRLEKVFNIYPCKLDDLPEQVSQTNNQSELQTNDELIKAYLWRDFFPVTKFEILSGRLVFGNPLVASTLLFTFEEAHITYTSRPAMSPHDLFTHITKCKAESFKIILAPSPKYLGLIDEPPRFMGDGFVVFQSNSIDFYYYQDEPGIMSPYPEQIELPMGDIVERFTSPAWGLDVKCGKGTDFSYGPWADRQRDSLYNFFYPPDYQPVEVTSKPKPGEKRIFESFEFRLSTLADATIDILFSNKEKETNALHINAGPGSYLEISIPYIAKEDGYATKIVGQILHLEATTILNYRSLVQSETLEFDVSMHYPLIWNAHQTWNCSLIGSKATVSIIYAHKEFFHALIEDWCGKAKPDILQFVPYTWKFNVFLKEFELITIATEHNWIDCSSLLGNENFQVAVCGETFDLSFDLPFVDFLPPQVPIKLWIQGESLEAALYLPECNPHHNIVSILSDFAKLSSLLPHASDSCSPQKVLTTSNLFPSHKKWRNIVKKSNGWFDCWNVPIVALSITYKYHPIPPKASVPRESEITTPEKEEILLEPIRPFSSANVKKCVTPDDFDPATMEPDLIELELEVGPSVMCLYGTLFRMLWDLKENYLGENQAFHDFASNPNQESLSSDRVNASSDVQLKPFDARLYRPLNVTVSVTLHDIHGHIMKSCSEDDPPCPHLYLERLCFEMDKTYQETKLQLILSPVFLKSVDEVNRTEPHLHLKNGYLLMTSLQFRGHAMFSGLNRPLDSETLEYAWLVEVQIGNIIGRLTLPQIHHLMIGLETFAFQVLQEDCSLQPPLPYHKCLHDKIQSECLETDKLNNKLCPYPEDIKYRMVRFSINSIDVCIAETNTAFSLQLYPIRFATCNLHSCHTSTGVTASIDNIILRHFMMLNNSNATFRSSKLQLLNPQLSDKEPNWLEVLNVNIGPLFVDAANLISDVNNYAISQNSFLTMHDAKTKRLWFLWPEETRNRNLMNKCGCVGGCVFFGTNRNGVIFFNTTDQRINLDTLFCRQKNGDINFGESLLNPGEPLLGFDLDNDEEQGSEEDIASLNFQFIDKGNVAAAQPLSPCTKNSSVSNEDSTKSNVNILSSTRPKASKISLFSRQLSSPARSSPFTISTPLSSGNLSDSVSISPSSTAPAHLQNIEIGKPLHQRNRSLSESGTEDAISSFSTGLSNQRPEKKNVEFITNLKCSESTKTEHQTMESRSTLAEPYFSADEGSSSSSNSDSVTLKTAKSNLQAISVVSDDTFKSIQSMTTATALTDMGSMSQQALHKSHTSLRSTYSAPPSNLRQQINCDTQSVSSASFISAVSSQEDIDLAALVDLRNQMEKPIVESPLLMSSYGTHLTHFVCKNWVNTSEESNGGTGALKKSKWIQKFMHSSPAGFSYLKLVKKPSIYNETLTDFSSFQSKFEKVYNCPGCVFSKIKPDDFMTNDVKRDENQKTNKQTESEITKSFEIRSEKLTILIKLSSDTDIRISPLSLDGLRTLVDGLTPTLASLHPLTILNHLSFKCFNKVESKNQLKKEKMLHLGQFKLKAWRTTLEREKNFNRNMNFVTSLGKSKFSENQSSTKDQNVWNRNQSTVTANQYEETKDTKIQMFIQISNINVIVMQASLVEEIIAFSALDNIKDITCVSLLAMNISNIDFDFFRNTKMKRSLHTFVNTNPVPTPPTSAFASFAQYELVSRLFPKKQKKEQTEVEPLIIETHQLLSEELVGVGKVGSFHGQLSRLSNSSTILKEAILTIIPHSQSKVNFKYERIPSLNRGSPSFRRRSSHNRGLFRKQECLEKEWESVFGDLRNDKSSENDEAHPCGFIMFECGLEKISLKAVKNRNEVEKSAKSNCEETLKNIGNDTNLRKGASFVCDVGVIWFNFAAPPKTPITRKIDFTKLDWHLLSTATPSINAWLTVGDRFIVAVKKMSHLNEQRVSSVIASLMTVALEIPGIHISPQSKHMSRKLTPFAKALQEDPSCQLMAVLRRYMKKVTSINEIEENLHPQFLPSLRDLKRGIVALSRQWKNALYMPLLVEQNIKLNQGDKEAYQTGIPLKLLLGESMKPTEEIQIELPLSPDTQDETENDDEKTTLLPEVQNGNTLNEKETGGIINPIHNRPKHKSSNSSSRGDIVVTCTGQTGNIDDGAVSNSSAAKKVSNVAGKSSRGSIAFPLLTNPLESLGTGVNKACGFLFSPNSQNSAMKTRRNESQQSLKSASSLSSIDGNISREPFFTPRGHDSSDYNEENLYIWMTRQQEFVEARNMQTSLVKTSHSKNLDNETKCNTIGSANSDEENPLSKDILSPNATMPPEFAFLPTSMQVADVRTIFEPLFISLDIDHLPEEVENNLAFDQLGPKVSFCGSIALFKVDIVEAENAEEMSRSISKSPINFGKSVKPNLVHSLCSSATNSEASAFVCERLTVDLDLKKDKVVKYPDTKTEAPLTSVTNESVPTNNTDAEEKVPIVIVGPEGGINEVTTVVNFSVNFSHITQRVNLPLLRLLHQFTTMYENIIEARLEMKANRIPEWKDDLHFKQFTDNLIHDIGTLNENETQSATPSTVSCQPPSKAKDETNKDQISISIPGDAESDTTLVEELIPVGPQVPTEVLQPKCWKTMFYLLDLYETTPATKTITERTTVHSLPEAKIQIEEDDDSALKNKGGYEQLKDYAVEMDELPTQGSIHNKGNVGFNIHPSQRKSMMNIMSSDQLKTYTHALIHRELTPLIVFGVVKIHKVSLVAMLSGLKLDGELSAFHLSLTHKEKVRGAALHSKRWKESSLTGQLGQTTISLLEEIPSSLQLVVKMTVGKSQTLISSQNKKGKDTNSAFLTIGPINIDIPQHPVALHGMVTRSSKQLSTTLQELRSSRQASRSSRQFESENITSSFSGAPLNGQQQNNIQQVPKEPLLRERTQTDVADGQRVDRSKLMKPIVVQFSVVLDSFEIGASLLPSLRAQYQIGRITSSGVSGTKAKFVIDIREHSLSFNTLVPASESNLPSSASVSLPPIHVSAEYMEDPLKNGRRKPTLRSESFAEGVVLRKGSFLNALADIGSFEHSLTTDLLNHLLLVQKVFMKEVNEVVQKMSGGDMKMMNTDFSEAEKSGNSSSSTEQNRNYGARKGRYLLFTLHLRLKGIQITATTPTNSALRLETGVMELQLSNRVQNMLTSSRSGPDLHLKLFVKLQVDLNLALGQLIKNALFEEAEPEFQQLAYFKTRIVMRNALQDAHVSSSSSNTEDKEAVLITLKRPLLYIQPVALDKAVLVWLNYKNAYEFWNEQRANLNKEVVNATQQVFEKVPPIPQFSTQTLGTLFLQLTVDDFGICLPISNPSLFQSSGAFGSKMNYDSELKSALVVTLENTRVSACSSGSLVSKAKFTGLCFRFADDFETSLDDWKPDPNDPSVMNICVVSEGTYEICSRTTTSHQTLGSSVSGGSDAKWFLNVSWKMEGFDIHVDTSIGKQFSALFKTLTALTGDEDEIDTADYSSVVDDVNPVSKETDEENVAPKNFTSPISGGDSKNITSTRKGSLFRDLSIDAKKRSRLIEKELNEQAKIINDLRQLGASQSTIEQEIKRLHELESAVFQDFKRDVIKKLRRQSLKKSSFREKIPFAKSKMKNDLHAATPEESFDIDEQFDPMQVICSQRGSLSQESEDLSPLSPEPHKRSISLDMKSEKIAENDEVDGSVPNQRADSITSVSGQKSAVQEPNIDFELDIQVFFSSGKCVFHTRDTSKEKDEETSRKNGLPKERSFIGNPFDQIPPSPSATSNHKHFKQGGSIHRHSVSGLKGNLSSSRLRYTISSGPGLQNLFDHTIFLIPGLDIKLHYNSKTAIINQPSVSIQNSTLGPNFQPRSKENDTQNTSLSMKKVGAKKAACYAWMVLHSIPEETVITPHILDFLEQALEPIPIQTSPVTKTPSPTTDLNQINGNVNDIEVPKPEIITSAPAQYAVYGSFPVDVIVYLHVQPSVLRFSCLPVSRVECLLQLPSVDLVFSSKRHQDELMDITCGFSPKPPIPHSTGPSKQSAKTGHRRTGSDFRHHQQYQSEAYISGLSVTGCLADFSLYIFHPYGGQKKTAGTTLNVSSASSEGTIGSPQSKSLSDRKDSLSLQVEFVKINISRSRKLLLSSEQHPSSKLNVSQDKQLHTVSIKFSALMDIGSASFKYDMRRLTEILAFPKAWYRKALWKRMFLGDQTMSGVFSDQEDVKDDGSLSSSSDESKSDDLLSLKPLTQTPSPNVNKPTGIKRQETLNRESLWLNLQDIGKSKSNVKYSGISSTESSLQQQRQLMNAPWETLILFGINLSKLNVHMNMGNVMGNTTWLTRGFRSEGRISIDSSGHKSFNVGLGLDGTSLDAKGGIVGGIIELSQIQTRVKVKENYGCEPNHVISLRFDALEKRLDYMGTSILMLRWSDLDLTLRDEWKIDCGLKQEVFEHPTKRPALIFIHCVLHWDQIQVMISKSTTPDIMKIIARLEEFFSQQFHSSKRVFSSLQPSKSFSRQSIKSRNAKTKTQPNATSTSNTTNTDSNMFANEVRHHRHWQRVLRLVSGVRISTLSHSLPAHGTILGGTFELCGRHISLACFYGVNFRSKSWGLFSMRQPNISFATEAQDIINESGENDTHIVQNFSFSLGRKSDDGLDFCAQHSSMANISRISRSVMFPPQFRQMHEWFQYAFSISELDEVNRFPVIEFERTGDALSTTSPVMSDSSSRRISVSPKSSEFHHNQEIIFALPSFQMELKTEHLQSPRTPSPKDKKPTVDCTFVTDFDDHIYVAVDAEAYFFLHELITSYIKEKDNNYSKTQSPAASERNAKSTKAETPPRDVFEKDFREFLCHTWHLEPTVRLLSWAGKNIEPYGVDYILQRLGFNQARTTIPKWTQRGAMDPLDKILSLCMFHVISAIKLQ